MQVGVFLSQIAFFTFGAKEIHIFCSCEPPVKNVPVFTLESDRPCLDWQLIWFLTSWPIYNPFKSQPKWRQKCKIWLWCQFYHRTVNHRKISNAPLDAPMCPLQTINWHWTSIIDPSWCKCMLYTLNPFKKVTILTSMSIFSKSSQLQKKFEICS